MRPPVEVHDALARLLEYPRERHAAIVEESASCVAATCPEAWEHLETFVSFAREHSLGELEELFTRTFDNTADRALEIGWHAFGENYTRGTFLVTMRQRLREHGVEENGELPDHLSHVLALLARCDTAKAALMVEHTVGPAVRKVHEELMQLENPWAPVLAAVVTVLDMHTAAPAPSGCEETTDA